MSGDPSNKLQGHIQIAAIDNGLAFPFKHPDSWRTCKVYFLLTLHCGFKYFIFILYCIVLLMLHVGYKSVIFLQIRFTGRGSRWQTKCSPRRYVIL